MERSLSGYITAKIRQPRAFGTSVKDAAIHPDRFRDRCVDHGPARAHGTRALDARHPESCGDSIYDLPTCGSCRKADHGNRHVHLLSGSTAEAQTWRRTRSVGINRGAATVADLHLLRHPNTLRPSLIRRMPRFNISDDEKQGKHMHDLLARSSIVLFHRIP